MTGTSTAGHNLILPENWQHIHGKKGKKTFYSQRPHILKMGKLISTG